MLHDRGIRCTGIDPTQRLIQHARERDQSSHYVNGRAEELPFPNESFDLVIAYLSLIDINDFRDGIREMSRVLCPGGSLWGPI